MMVDLVLVNPNNRNPAPFAAIEPPLWLGLIGRFRRLLLKTACAETFPKLVPKVWGREIWLVNLPEYCCKLLEVNKGANGSLHYHKEKKETFIVVIGTIQLELGKEVLKMKSDLKVVTIEPGVHHRFKGLKASTILEISTCHRDEDVVRLEESKA